MAFNPDDFLSQSRKAGLSTTFPVIPEGKYPGQCREVTVNQREINNEERTIVTTKWELLDDDLRDELDREHVYCNFDFFIDFDETGDISTEEGKNVSLGKFLDAFDMNDKDWSFSDFVDLEGLCNVKVTSKKGDPSTKYSNITSVVPE